MTQFIRYTLATGQIHSIGDCPDDQLADQAAAGLELMPGEADLFTDYILAGVVTPRPASPATINKTTFTANGTDTCIISSMINPSIVSFTSPSSVTPIPTYTDTDGTLTFSATEIGAYTITLTSFPYLDKIFTLTAI